MLSGVRFTSYWKTMALIIMVFMIIMMVTACGQETNSGQGIPSEQESNASEAPFYKDKTITLIVATKAGGGYDTYARLLARYMEKYLPGSTIIVKNVDGAGHIIGCNETYNADPDGLTFGTFNKGLITSQLAGFEGIRFDLADMSWIGSMTTESRTFVVSPNSPFKTIDDVINSGQEVLMSSAGVGSTSHTDTLMVAEILGIDNFKLVSGYQGNEADMAMMRGEIHGQIGSYTTMKPLIENGDAIPILMINNKRMDEYPDVPNILELSPEKTRPLADFMVSQGLITRPFAGPPGIHQERLDILREAFEKACQDPGLLADAEKMDITIELITGGEVEQLVKDALNQPPELVELIIELTKEE